MDKEISLAVSYALNKGFQIHPNALEILHKIDVRELGRLSKMLLEKRPNRRSF